MLKLYIRIKYVVLILWDLFLFIISLPFHLLYKAFDLIIAIPQTIANQYVYKPLRSFILGIVILFIIAFHQGAKEYYDTSFFSFLRWKIATGHIGEYCQNMWEMLSSKEWLQKFGGIYVPFYIVMFFLQKVLAICFEILEENLYFLFYAVNGNVYTLRGDLRYYCLCIRYGVDDKNLGMTKLFDEMFKKKYGGYRLIKDVHEENENTES